MLDVYVSKLSKLLNQCTRLPLFLHDDVIKWKHFSHYCFFMYAWINDSVNNAEAGDLRRHRTHYDVTVMTQFGIINLRSYL